MKIADLPGPCKDVQIGLEFNLYLLEDGSVHLNGAITQEGDHVIESIDQLYCISEFSKVKFKQIQCGYSHAVLIDEDDQVYSFGANLYGQLGVGIDHFKSVEPMPIPDVNDGLDKVLMIACGAHFSLCYTELGILYYWGMLVPEDTNSI